MPKSYELAPEPPVADPRHGRPSASSFKRYRNCRSSWRMEREAVRQRMVPPEGADAISGTKIARWLETKSDADFEALSLDEQTTADIIDSQEARVISEWSNAELLGEGEMDCRFRELRLGLTEMGKVIKVDETTSVPLVYTGQLDLLVIEGKRGILIDDKSGRRKVADAAGNEQLMALAPLVAEYFGLDSVRAVIVQPLCGPPTQADYDRGSLIAALAFAEALVTNIESEGPDLTAGDWCQYCPARAICPAMREAATSAPEALELSTVPLGDSEHARSVLTARAMDLPAMDLSRLLKGRRLIGWYLSAIEAAARMRLERGEAVPGYELLETNGRRSIKDASAAAAAVAPLLVNADGGSAAALLRCASLRPKGLQDEVHKAGGRKSRTRYNMTGAQAKEVLAAALGPLMSANKVRKLVEVGAVIEDSEEEGGDE